MVYSLLICGSRIISEKGCTDQLGTSRYLLNLSWRYIQIQPLEPLPACLMFALFEGISLLPALVHAD